MAYWYTGSAFFQIPQSYLYFNCLLVDLTLAELSMGDLTLTCDLTLAEISTG